MVGEFFKTSSHLPKISHTNNPREVARIDCKVNNNLTPTSRAVPTKNTRLRKNVKLPAHLKDHQLYMYEEQDKKGKIVS